MRKQLLFAALLMPFAASSAMAAITVKANNMGTQQVLFPPANATECVSGTDVKGFLVWVDQGSGKGYLTCQPMTLDKCPEGSVYEGITGAVPNCKKVADIIKTDSTNIYNDSIKSKIDFPCPSGQVLQQISAGVKTCVPNIQPKDCSAAGQVMVGINSDGSVKCGYAVPNKICGSGTVVGSIVNDVVSCVTDTVGGGTVVPPPEPPPVVTPPSPPASDPLDVTSCVNSYCSGKNSVIYPGRNGARFPSGTAAENVRPVRCDGDWWVDTRGTTWESYCSTGMVSLANCQNPLTGMDFANCPDKTPIPASLQVETCQNHMCGGANSRVTFINGNGKRASGTCAGYWTANVKDSNWEMWCSTGGGLGMPSFSDVYEGNGLTSCDRAQCSGNNNVVFPGRNAAGWYNNTAYECKSAWTSDTRSAYWESTCPTGWVARDCKHPETLQTISGCPASSGIIGNPANAIACTGHYCAGYNLRISVKIPTGKTWDPFNNVVNAANPNAGKTLTGVCYGDFLFDNSYNTAKGMYNWGSRCKGDTTGSQVKEVTIN